jgi:hypothetical protein
MRPLMFITTLALCAAAFGPRGGGVSSTVFAQDACGVNADPGTVQSAINGAAPDTVICLAPGVYPGPVVVDGKTGITLRGAGSKVSIVAGGPRDSLLVFNSRDITFEDFTLFYGHPANAYVWRSQNVVFRRIDAGGGGIGIHFDGSTTGRISDSFVYAMEGDGVLIRRNSNAIVERNWVFDNGGVGVSTVGETATTAITRNIISDNEGPGVFAGQTPCALLPPGHVEVPECYLGNLQAFVGEANILLDANIIQFSNSTGIVMFPGTRGTFRNNRIWFNHLSGLFAWGANVTSDGDEYVANDEHAIEFRAYPDPLKYGAVGPDFPVRAVGTLVNNVIRDTVVLPETGTLGGGVLGQGANLDVRNSRIYTNRGIGVSYVNTSIGEVSSNEIYDNRGSAVCLFRAGKVVVRDNAIRNNVVNEVGVCRETTPD